MFMFMFMFMDCKVFRRIELLFQASGVTRRALVYSRNRDKEIEFVHNDERSLSLRGFSKSTVRLAHFAIVSKEKRNSVRRKDTVHYPGR